MRRHLSPTSRAFSLVELMVVILIIALIIAIVLPSLGGARNLAKRADSESLATQLAQAIGQFQTENRRLPGHFSVRDMAHPENNDRGMTMAENVMIELLGLKISTTPPTGAGWIEVGPMNSAATHIWVKQDENSGKAFFAPPAKYYVAQTTGFQVGVVPHTAGTGVLQLPDLVDAFGQPYLIWIEDSATPGKPVATTASNAGQGVAFARQFYRAADGAAKFYWGTNSAFLRTDTLGRLRGNMADGTTNFLGAATPGDPQMQALGALLGNPAFPGFPANNQSAAIQDIFPTAARGSYAIHSAGADGLYLGKNTKTNRGAAQGVGGTLFFGSAIKSAAGTAHTDSSGKVTNLDFAKEFDDVLVSGN